MRDFRPNRSQRRTISRNSDLLIQRTGDLREDTAYELDRRYIERAKGDVTDTLADNSRARSALGFAPHVGLEEGLRLEKEWIESTALRLVGSANGEVG